MRPALFAAAFLASTALVSVAPASAQVGLAMPQPVPMPDAMPAARDIPYPGTIRLDIDASDTSRGIYRVVETIPVRPGPLTLLYPKWLPGTHSPTGPIDKIAGFMFKHGIGADDKIFYTTGRLTSEMVIKTVRMGIPILVSRSGFTAWGVELARKANLTLVGRARGKRFVALAGEDRIVFDQDLDFVEEESAKHRRKAAMHDD